MTGLRAAAAERDATAIAAIYAHHVAHGTGTFEEVAPTAAEMRDRVAAVTGRGWPWLVAEADGAMLGYAYAGQFRDRAAYRFTCEGSVYIRHDAMGRGLGAMLLAGLVDAARAAGFERMIAVIGDSRNHASLRLHVAQGFTHAGVLTDAGFKFGRHVDVVLMQRAL